MAEETRITTQITIAGSYTYKTTKEDYIVKKTTIQVDIGKYETRYKGVQCNEKKHFLKKSILFSLTLIGFLSSLKTLGFF